MIKRLRTGCLALIVAVCLATAVSGATYYVDSNNGSDSNNGLSRARAFQTIGKMLTVYAASDRIFLARGSEWHESCDLSAYDGGIIRPYGSGALPKILGWNLADWSTLAQPDSGTYPNVYSVDLVLASGWGANTYVSIREDDQFLERIVTTNTPSAGNYTTCNANAGTCICPDPTNSGTLKIYFHVSSATEKDPRNTGRSYRHTARLNALKVGDNWDVRGVVGEQCGDSDGAIIGTTGTDFNLCMAAFNTEHCFWVPGNGTATNCIVYWPETTSLSSLASNGFISYGGAETATQTITLTDCDVVVPSEVADNTSGVGAFYGHVGGGAGFQSVTLTRCRAYGRFRSVSYQAQALTLTSCTVFGTGADCPYVQLDGAGTLTLTSSTFASMLEETGGQVTNGLVLVGNSSADAVTAAIDECTFVYSGDSGAVAIRFYSNATISVTNSTGLAVNPSGSNAFIAVRDGTVTGATLTLDSVVTYDFQSPINCFQAGNTISATDNNDYFKSAGHPTGGNMIWDINGTDYSGLAAYQAGVTPQEAASVDTDPSFTDVDNFNLTTAAGGPSSPMTALPTVPTYSDCLMALERTLDAGGSSPIGPFGPTWR